MEDSEIRREIVKSFVDSNSCRPRTLREIANSEGLERCIAKEFLRAIGELDDEKVITPSMTLGGVAYKLSKDKAKERGYF